MAYSNLAEVPIVALLEYIEGLAEEQRSLDTRVNAALGLGWEHLEADHMTSEQRKRFLDLVENW